MFCKHHDYTARERTHDTSFVLRTPSECLRWLNSLMSALVVCGQCICFQQRKANRIPDLHLEATRQCLWRKSIHSSRCRFLAVLETINNELQQHPKVIIHESQRGNDRSKERWLCVQLMLLGEPVHDRHEGRVFRRLFGEHFLERFSCWHAFFSVFQHPQRILSIARGCFMNNDFREYTRAECSTNNVSCSRCKFRCWLCLIIDVRKTFSSQKKSSKQTMSCAGCV